MVITTMIKTSNKQGFTLIEMMVAVSLFVVVAFIITSTFTSFADANRRAQAVRTSVDNLNFAMESIVLKIREGNAYTCGLEAEADITDCSQTPATAVNFKVDNGNTVQYSWDEDLKTIFKCEHLPGDAACDQNSGTQIVSDEVQVEKLNFYVRNGTNPLVKIVIGGQIDSSAGSREFILQTSISQRPWGPITNKVLLWSRPLLPSRFYSWPLLAL